MEKADDLGVPGRHAMNKSDLESAIASFESTMDLANKPSLEHEKAAKVASDDELLEKVESTNEHVARSAKAEMEKRSEPEPEPAPEPKKKDNGVQFYKVLKTSRFSKDGFNITLHAGSVISKLSHNLEELKSIYKIPMEECEAPSPKFDQFGQLIRP